jgi:solute carrier family 25 protein 34/35
MAALFTNPLEVRPSQILPGSAAAGAADAKRRRGDTRWQVVKTRLQVQGEMVASNAAAKRYSGLLDALVKIPREEGLRAIQKGLGPGMLYQFAMNGARLGTYPTLKRALDADGGHSRAGTALRHTAAGGVAGALGAVAGSPLFMVKCRLQAQSSLALAQADSGAAGMGHQHKYAGAIDGLRTVRARRAAGQPVEAAPPQRAAW